MILKAIVQMAITIDNVEPSYVEHRGGYALLSHLRGAPSRVEHRRDAIQRAFDLFAAAERTGRHDPEVGGLGLLVLQRALLAAEDLGGLLHAFAGDAPWDRLRSARIPDLDAAFRRAEADLESTVTTAFRLATTEQINAAVTGEDRAVLHQLRRYAMRRWAQMLGRSAWLWLHHRNVAKATMHGFPIVAGAHVDGPPPAGELADGFSGPNHRYVVALTSRVTDRQVATHRTIVSVDRRAVSDYHRYGRGTARLVGELCELQTTTMMSQHACSVPLRFARFLDKRSQTIAEALLTPPHE